MLVGVDPGRDKCGLAVVDPPGSLVWRGVIPTDQVLQVLTDLRQRYGCERLIMGNQTTSKQWQGQLQVLEIPIVLVDERFSTQEARRRYWQFVQPQGWRRWLPPGLRPLPSACDDIAAAILVERYLRQDPQEHVQR
ncbi:MAG: resolvase [Synechococcales cyanobacterium]